MKNFYKLVMLLLIAGFTFSSCSSGLSLSKANPNSQKSKFRSKIFKKSKESSPVITIEQSDDRLTASIDGAVVMHKESEKEQLSGNAATMIPAELMISNPVTTIKNFKARVSADPARSEAIGLFGMLVIVLLGAYGATSVLKNFGLSWLVHVLLAGTLVALIMWLLNIN